MSDLKGLIIGLMIAAAVYIADRYLPKWFGALPGIAFLGLMIFLLITKGHHQVLSMMTVLIVGEAVLNGIWMESLDSRKKKEQRELEKMKAKDYLK